MNDFTEGQRALIRQIAQSVAEELKDDLLEAFDERIKLHALSCERRQLPRKLKWFMVGAIVGGGLLGGGAGFGLSRLIWLF